MDNKQALLDSVKGPNNHPLSAGIEPPKGGVGDNGKSPGQQQNFQINIQQYFISQQNPQPASTSFDSRSDLYSQSNPTNLINVSSTHPNAPTGASGPSRVIAVKQDRVKNQDKDGFQYYNNQQNTRKGHKQSNS